MGAYVSASPEKVQEARDALMASLARVPRRVKQTYAAKMAREPEPEEPMVQFLRLSEVTRLTGLSRSSIYRGVSSGFFPKPVPLCPSGRTVGWVSAEVAAWQQQRMAARG